MALKFVRRSRDMPCPVCGKKSWCSIDSTGTVARCMRVRSAQESKAANGEIGYIHDVIGPPKPVSDWSPEKQFKLPQEKVAEIARQCYHHPLARGTRRRVSKQLGVSIEALSALQVGFGRDRDGREYSSWPSRDEELDIIGITRRYSDGSKKSFYGSRNGVFVPVDQQLLRTDPIIIVEGGSDVAAAYDHDRFAIGRPSNQGGATIIRHRWADYNLLVIGENDRKSCANVGCECCAACWPGLFGAMKVASQLGCKYWMPTKGAKDLREWYECQKTKTETKSKPSTRSKSTTAETEAT